MCLVVIDSLLIQLDLFSKENRFFFFPLFLVIGKKVKPSSLVIMHRVVFVVVHCW